MAELRGKGQAAPPRRRPPLRAAREHSVQSEARSSILVVINYKIFCCAAFVGAKAFRVWKRNHAEKVLAHAARQPTHFFRADPLTSNLIYGILTVTRYA